MIELRPYQRQAVDATYLWMENNPGNCIIVLPTASGKSLCIATFIKEALGGWPDTRILVLTHVRELITQNLKETLALWPECPAGIHSAGLGQRDVSSQVIFAGIQSVHHRAYDLQRIDLVIVDECHLIPRSSTTMYRRFLNDLKLINPYLRVVGASATPYRLDSGRLDKGPDALFDGIAYEAPMRELIEQGYLSPLVSKQTNTQLDVTGVATRGGEFVPNQLAAAVDLPEVTRAAVREVVEAGRDRRSWLLFGSGVDHAKHISSEIRAHGVTCATIFGDTPKSERDLIVEEFKAGRIRALACMNTLTTGFNAPRVDLIGLLRPTQSTGLFVQMVGRGSRLAPGKQNCLVLDFAQNIRRHGPVDAVDPKAGNRGEGDGEAPVKTCPECKSFVLISAQTCPDCGHQFPPPEVKIQPRADTAPILSKAQPDWLQVDRVEYARHEKEGKPPSLRVTYIVGLTSFREWVCLEHEGFAREKAASWWARRAPGTRAPRSVSAALEMKDILKTPSEIAVMPRGRYHDIVGARF